MELNGGLAFGSALLGGALFGPMGAFMALPVAALIYSFIKTTVGTTTRSSISRHTAATTAPSPTVCDTDDAVHFACYG